MRTEERPVGRRPAAVASDAPGEIARVRTWAERLAGLSTTRPESREQVADSVVAPPAPTRRDRLTRVMVALTVLQAVAFVVMVLSSAVSAWGVARVVVVVALASAAVAVLLMTPRWAAGLVALGLGIAGTAAGVGIGVMHLVSGSVTVTSVSAIVALVTGVALWSFAAVVLLGGIRGRWPRRAIGVLTVIAVLLLVQYPVTSAVVATNRAPTSVGAHTPADLGLPFEEVTIRTVDDVALSAWYVPSSNGAAVVVRHGAGSTKEHVLEHAAVLADHGYGALLMDARGHGASDGVAMDFGWYGDHDIEAGLTYLVSRAEVEDSRVGVLGLSMGGEEAIGAAAADRRIAAVVAEGVSGRTSADLQWLPSHPGRYVNLTIAWVRDQVADLLSSASPPLDLRAAVRRTAPRPVLLIAASGGITDELRPARWLQHGSPSTVSVWEMPQARHIQGLRTDAHEWEIRVIGFFDRALSP